MVEIIIILFIGWIAAGGLLLCNYLNKNFEDNGDRKIRLAELIAEATDNINREKDLEKLEEIYNDIEIMQKQGCYAIGGDGYIGDVIKKELKSQGFKVETFSEYSGYQLRHSYIIRWDKFRRYK